MDKVGSSKSASQEVTIKSDQGWAQVVSEAQAEGLRMVKQLKEQGDTYDMVILAPKEIKGGDTIPLSGTFIPLDWKIAKRREMVKNAVDFISNAYIVDSLVPGLPTVLSSVIGGKGLYEHSIGEFFQLYGQFEGKYQLETGTKTKAKMETLVNGDRKYFKPVEVLGKRGKVKVERQPLPYAVRNILAHLGTTRNTLDVNGEELKTSIELLRLWVGSDGTVPDS